MKISGDKKEKCSFVSWSGFDKVLICFQKKTSFLANTISYLSHLRRVVLFIVRGRLQNCLCLLLTFKQQINYVFCSLKVVSFCQLYLDIPVPIPKSCSVADITIRRRKIAPIAEVFTTMLLKLVGICFLPIFV